MSILQAEDLTYAYPDGTLAIRGVSLNIEKGEKISFVGKNGSGKSTLFFMLNGTFKPRSGKLRINDEEVEYSSSGIRNLRKNVGIVFQNSDDQIFAPTVYQDIAFGPSNLGYSRSEVDAIVQNMLDYFGLNAFKDKPPHHLSGGQKKRVAIAGVLSMNPDIIILDEPLSNLDPVGSDEIMNILNELQHMGKTIIISTHDVDLAYSWSDKVYLMSEGEVVVSGEPMDVFSHEDLLRRSSLKTPVLLDTYKELEKRWLASYGFKPTNIPELVGTLRDINLFRVQIPPGTVVGDCINVGFLYCEYDPNGLYESVNSRVLCIDEDGTGVVEVKKKILKPGSIHVYDIDNFDASEFFSFCKKNDINFIAAMGKRSQYIAEKENISIHANYGVIDKSILKALMGDRCLIMTGHGMVPHTCKRISTYGQESGIKIYYSIANPVLKESDISENEILSNSSNQ